MSVLYKRRVVVVVVADGNNALTGVPRENPALLALKFAFVRDGREPCPVTAITAGLLSERPEYNQHCTEEDDLLARGHFNTPTKAPRFRCLRRS